MLLLLCAWRYCNPKTARELYFLLSFSIHSWYSEQRWLFALFDGFLLSCFWYFWVTVYFIDQEIKRKMQIWILVLFPFLLLPMLVEPLVSARALISNGDSGVLLLLRKVDNENSTRHKGQGQLHLVVPLLAYLSSGCILCLTWEQSSGTHTKGHMCGSLAAGSGRERHSLAFS